VSATIRLTRQLGFGIELWRGRFDVTVDGDHLAFLEAKETIEEQVDPGHHALRVAHGRYTSPTREFDVTDGETVTFRCHGANLWPVFVASLAVPSLAISLRRE
jgi:hypothetical protein